MIDAVEGRSLALRRVLEEKAEKVSAIAQSILRARDPNLTAKVKRKVELIQAEAEDLYEFFRRRQKQDGDDGEPLTPGNLLLDRDFVHDLRSKICNLMSGASGTAAFVDPSAAKIHCDLGRIGEIATTCLGSVDDLRKEIISGEVARPPSDPVFDLQPPELSIFRRTIGKILIADDNQHSRETLVEILERDNHAVTAVEDGQAAIDATLDLYFHVIILDLRMPNVDGFQVLQELGRRRILSRTSVIVISGLSDRDTASAAIRLGARDFLLRPINLSYLSARVDSVVEERVRAEANRALVNPVHATFLSAPRASYPPLEVRAYLEQLMEVGGDCYFHHQIADGCLLAGVADVSGDGWPAALDMARTATLIAHLASTCSPDGFSSWLVGLNNTLHGFMRGGRNSVALTVLLFDFPRRAVQAACFGQYAPIYRDVVTGTVHLLPVNRHGRMGVRILQKCATKTFSMASASHWFIFSDGFTEASVGGGKQLGTAGLISLLREIDWVQPDGLPQVVANWKAALPAGARDDATLLAIKDHSMLMPVTWRGIASAEALQSARSFLSLWLCAAGFPPKLLPQLLIACDEILTNIVRHAYAGIQHGDIRIAIEMAGNSFRICFEHDGIAISQREVDYQFSLPCRNVGGGGLRLAQRLFTRLQYETNEGRLGGRITCDREFDWAANISSTMQ